jgi:hypothetical protein
MNTKVQHCWETPSQPSQQWGKKYSFDHWGQEVVGEQEVIDAIKKN